MHLVRLFGKRYVYLLDPDSNLCLYKVDDSFEEWSFSGEETSKWEKCKSTKPDQRKNVFEVLRYDEVRKKHLSKFPEIDND